MEENCADKRVREETKSILAKYKKDEDFLWKVSVCFLQNIHSFLPWRVL